jgi:hypothetical protein
VSSSHTNACTYSTSNARHYARSTPWEKANQADRTVPALLEPPPDERRIERWLTEEELQNLVTMQHKQAAAGSLPRPGDQVLTGPVCPLPG